MQIGIYNGLMELSRVLAFLGILTRATPRSPLFHLLSCSLQFIRHQHLLTAKHCLCISDPIPCARNTTSHGLTRGRASSSRRRNNGSCYRLWGTFSPTHLMLLSHRSRHYALVTVGHCWYNLARRLHKQLLILLLF
jgi:hypothetical protein